MKLVIVHHHFRPGGVRRVIEMATPHLVAHWPVPISTVVLAAGEEPDPTWLKTFRSRLSGTPVKTVVQPAFGYRSELALPGKTLERLVAKGVRELLWLRTPGGAVIWAHNLGLGRNLYLSRKLTFSCDCCHIPLVMHHHDWWFDNRWHHFAAMQEPGFRRLPAMAEAILVAAPTISHVAINHTDAKVLEKFFPNFSGWLPNPVEPEKPPSSMQIQTARAWLAQQVGSDAPVWLLPCRLLRRKNLLEALLLTRWLRPGAWLVTTGGVSSAEEKPYAEALMAAAQTHGWPLRLGVLQEKENDKPSVRELMAASEAVMLTSLQEGFGLPYLEAAAADRPLVARQLPNIAPDLKEFGFSFPQSYREIQVDPTLFDWPGEQERQARAFAAWKRLMPRTANRQLDQPAVLAAGREPVPVPFSRLTLTAQLEVLAQPIEHSWERCLPLNPCLKTWRERAAAGQLQTSPWPSSAKHWLGGQAYARRFLALVPDEFAKWPRRGVGPAAQQAFLRQKLRSENLYPLLWHSHS